MWQNPVLARASVTSTSGFGPIDQAAEELEDQPVVVDEGGVGLLSAEAAAPAPRFSSPPLATRSNASAISLSSVAS